MAKNYNIIAFWLLLLSFLLLILLSPLLAISFNEEIHEKARNHQTLAHAGAITSQEGELSNNVMQYLKGEESLSYMFSANEQAHMKDVKSLFDAAKLIVFVSAVTALFIVGLLLRRGKSSSIKRALMLSSASGLAVCALILAGILLDFQKSFVGFHHLLFPNGNWMFPADSLLITIYPESFFMNMGILIFLCTVLACIAIIAVLALHKRSLSRNY